LRERNQLSSWNPRVPATLTPTEFEQTVLAWLRKCGQGRDGNAKAEHLGVVAGAGGEYKIDVLAQISIFGGAIVVILVECKHQQRPVEREDVMVVEAKLRDVSAHKGILFSTSGFQKGAIEYASAHGIATVAVVNGTLLYETKGGGFEPPTPPSWARLDRFAGVRMSSEDAAISCHTLDLNRIDALKEWLTGIKSPE
jgi:restriction system protein